MPVAPFPHAGEIAALATASCWVVAVMAFESAARRIGSLSLNLIRLLIALLLLTAFSTLTRGVPLPFDASPHAWFWLGLSGLVGFTLGDLCLFRAFVLLGGRLASLVMALVPLFTTLFGWLVLGELLTPTDLGGMLLVISGVAFVVLERTADANGARRHASARGVALALGGALGQALGLVLSKHGMRDYDAFAATQIRVISGAAGFSVLFVFIGWWPRVRAALRNGPGLGLATLGACFGPFLGVGLSLVAVKYTQAGVAATLMALLPVLIIPPSVFIRRERVTLRAVVGAVAAVGGATLLFV